MNKNRLAASIAGAMLIAANAHAQDPLAPSDSACTAAADSARVDPTTTWSSILHVCGPMGARSIAQALTSVSASSDERMIGSAVAMAGLRDPAILQAAITLATSASSEHGRAAGVMILAQQAWGYRAALLTPQQQSGLSAFTDSTVVCAVWHGDIDVGSGDPLPSNAQQTIREVSESLARDPGITARLRAMARCLRNSYDPPMRAVLPPGALTVRYLCDNVFEISNSSAVAVDVEAVVLPQTATSSATVPAHGKALVCLDVAGTTRFSASEVVIADVVNPGVPCT